MGEGDKAKGRQIVERIIVVKRNFYGFANFRAVWNEQTRKWENDHVIFLEELGIKKQKIRELIESNIQAFSGGNFQRSYRYFVNHFGEGNEDEGKRILKEIIESNENFYGFVNFRVHLYGGEWRNTHVDFLGTLGFTKPEIIGIMKNNIQAFSEGNLDQLEKAYNYLMNYFGGEKEGHKRLKRIIANGGFAGFVNFRVLIDNDGILYNTHVDFLEDEQKLGFERSKVLEFMENNLRAFSEGILAELNQAYKYLTNYLGKGDKREGKRLLKAIIESRGGLHNFIHFKVNKQEDNNIYKNKVVAFLEDTMNFDQEQIIKLLIETRLHAFPAVDIDELNQSYRYLVHYLGEGNQIRGREKFERIIKKKGGLKAFVRFRVIEINGKEKNEVINFLEQAMTFHQKTVIKIIERDFTRLFESELTQANSESFLDRLTMQLAPNECIKSLSSKK